ncbi:glycosyltransferase family 2 protein [Belliella sp. DSM 107340]|uniref:Glycosyltransferase family 2 protein n=1 Tax=Belliella calami TaxID=2923436 RepID=A0ABS9UTW8_9BACT|nr:glycosyltransferase family A protein [Belliella calami]MCH7400061.1 glycosyltransferase family 2 protein [Belliella calami]
MSNNQPLVSVIIPCFNHQNYIVETVNSVLGSIHKNLEIIIVNDGSEDNSWDIIQSLEKMDKRIKGINQNNQGPSNARNNGISSAKGEIILPLDGDDLISENYISEAVAVLQGSNDVKLVYCLAEKFGMKSGFWKLKPFSLSSLAKDNMIFISAIFRKEDWKAVGGFDANMSKGWEDWEFWISLLKNGGNVVQLPFIGFYYRILAQSRRKCFRKSDKYLMIDYLNSKHYDFFKKYHGGPLHYQRGLSKLINRWAGIFKMKLSFF